MAAIVAGASLGLTNSSLALLGGQGQVGSATHGASGERVYVNSTTGNLVIQRRDELVVGVGNDVAVVRTYNSQGRFDDDNGDNWRIGIYKRVTVTGTPNAANSTVTRVDGDGAESVYTYNTTLGKYVNTDGDGAFDTLQYNATSQLWTWTDGSTQMVEEYDGANGGRIKRALDPDGNAQVYTYNAAGLFTRVTDASGQFTDLLYGANNNLTELTVRTDGKILTRTRYQYDGLNRLFQVNTDFSPGNATAEANYVVTYTYDGTSTRIASLIQTDGNNISFLYDASGRVSSFTDANGKVTSLNYTQGGSAGAPATAKANNAVLSTTETLNASQAFNLNNAALTSSGNKLQNWSTVNNISGATGTWTYYTIDVPAGQSELFVSTSGGSGDADFYVRYGAQPDTATFDARGWDYPDANEAAVIQNPASGTWYIGVLAFTAISGAQLHTHYAAGTTVLQPGVAAGDLYGPKGSQRLFSFNVAAGTSSLKLSLTGQAGQDVDLYLKAGTPPTTTAFGFKSDGLTANESITVSTPQAGTWYALV